MRVEDYFVDDICTISNVHVEQGKRNYKYLRDIYFSDVSRSIYKIYDFRVINRVFSIVKRILSCSTMGVAPNGVAHWSPQPPVCGS